MDLGSFPSWTVKVGPENPRSLKMMNPNSHHMNGFVAVSKLSIYRLNKPLLGFHSRMASVRLLSFKRSNNL